MAWARISDDFHDHPKVAELTVDLEGLAALGLWTLALTWVRADRRRNGEIPTGIALRLAASNGKQLASRLVEANLWDEIPGGYRFHDFDQVYSPGDLSAKRAEAGRRGGIASGKSRSGSNPEANSKQLASEHEAKGLEASHARAGATTHYPEGSNEPSNPPTPQRGKARRSAPADYDSDPDFTRFWDVYPLKTGKPAAFRAWRNALKRKADPEQIIDAARRYRTDPRRKPEYTKHPGPWLNDERYNDQPTLQVVNGGGGWWNN